MSNVVIGILYTIAMVILVIIGLKILSKVLVIGIFLLLLAVVAAVLAIKYYVKKEKKKNT